MLKGHKLYSDAQFLELKSYQRDLFWCLMERSDNSGVFMFTAYDMKRFMNLDSLNAAAEAFDSFVRGFSPYVIKSPRINDLYLLTPKITLNAKKLPLNPNALIHNSILLGIEKNHANFEGDEMYDQFYTKYLKESFELFYNNRNPKTI